jgi:hypothetical protein
MAMPYTERKNPFNLRYSVFFINRKRAITALLSEMQWAWPSGASHPSDLTGDAQALLFVKMKGKQ